ncbi:GNAT family N-acetyltransferase [Haloglycomyces albus]|uniref:GNAT family N-acetyltransferase n=1 Tax=Haloglycomyces albus TaxID=526067 RepID=UPI00046D75DA|nr:GNAT family N-acetyltransferase [Haloglycomyces albus]
MTQSIIARPALSEDRDKLVEAFQAGCRDEAVFAWAGGDNTDFIDRHMENRVPTYLDGALERDEIWIAGDDHEIWTVAICTVVHDTERLEAEAVETESAARETGLHPLHRFAAATRLVADSHPRRFPHLYLNSIVTDSAHRGKGAGRTLLRRLTEWADGRNLPQYLEASTTQSARLYGRMGFTATGKRLPLPDSGPVLIPMWRDVGQA